MAKKSVNITSIVVDVVTTAVEASRAIAREHDGAGTGNYARMEERMFEFEGAKFSPLDILASTLAEAGADVPEEFTPEWFHSHGCAAFRGKWGKLVVGIRAGGPRPNAPTLSQLRK